MSEVEVSHEGNVATLTLSEPGRRNTITDAQVDALTSALEAVAADDVVRAVVITGSEDVFHVGGDMNAAASSVHRRSVEAYREQMLKVGRIAVLLHTMAKPTIAAVNGGCAGAGFGIALACDLRYAAHEARFNTAFLNVGLPGELGAMWFATRIVGTGRARELFLLPEKLDAGYLCELGLVNQVFPRASLLSEVMTRAQRVAGAAPLAARAMKANLIDAAALSLESYLSAEAGRMAAVGCSDDALEGRLAFKEKRPPVYQGR